MEHMRVVDFTRLAKQAQLKLKSLNMPADHIYLIGYSDQRAIPSLVFVSSVYNRLDIYQRSRLATVIQKGPLKYNFYVMGTDHIGRPGSVISRDLLYKAVKLYGKQALTIDGVEYASQQDMNFAGSAVDSIVV